jgi:hypothetical protein
MEQPAPGVLSGVFSHSKFSVEYWLTEPERDHSRKDAKHAKFRKTGKYFFFALLAS